MSIDLKIYGTRGSIPCTAANCLTFGGATSCYHFDLGGRHLIFDAGTGLVELGNYLMQEAQGEPIDLFFTHFHYDHVLGLPFFPPLYVKGWPVRLWTSALFGGGAIDLALDCLFSTPLCPVTRDLLIADISINELEIGVQKELWPGVRISTISLSHPGGNAAYRVEHGGEAFVFTGDFEHGDADKDAALVKFLNGAKLAFLDSTYTPESYPACKGFGHAHWDAAGQIATQAGVVNWLGVHHEHTLGDSVLLRAERALQQKYPNGGLARKGATFKIG